MGNCQKEKTFISAVIYLHNDGSSAVRFMESVEQELSASFENYEYILVNDACTDDTIKYVKKWSDNVNVPITIIHMSLYHGVEDSMNAGIDAAIGDFVYEFDSTQMPYDKRMIIEAYRKAISGNDIVCVCPDQVNASSRLFYWIFNTNSDSVYKIHTDAFRLVSRRLINRVHSSHLYLPYRKAAYASSGLKMCIMSFSGRVSNNQKSRIDMAVDSLALYTNVGYKISIWITLIMMLVSALELIYTVVIYIIGKPIVGWTTTMLVISFGFLGLFFILSIVIKYMAINLDMAFRKQKYLIERVEKIQK